MFEQEYKDVFSKVIASERLYERVLHGEHRKKSNGTLFAVRIGLVAVIAAMLVACTTIVYDSRPMLEAVLGINGRETYESYSIQRLLYPSGYRTELDMELAEKYTAPHIREVNKTVSDGDTVLTVEAYLIDRATSTGILYMRMENSPEYRVYDSGQMFWYENEDAGSIYRYVLPQSIGCNITIGKWVIDNEMTTEDTLVFALMFACPEECQGMKISIGESKDSITMDFPKKTELKSVQLADGAITLSPFGAEMELEPFGFTDILQERQISILYENGEEYIIYWEENRESYTGCSYQSASGENATSMVYIFNRVVDLEKVKAFVINGVEYPVE